MIKSIFNKHKVFIYGILLLTIFCYTWFVAIPYILSISFPTGGLDWLNYVATISGVFIAYLGIVQTIEMSNKDREENLKPYLSLDISKQYINPFINFKTNRGSYIKLQMNNNKIYNEGFILIGNLHDSSHQIKDTCIRIDIRNIGLGSMYNLTIELKKLVDHHKFNEINDNILDNDKNIYNNLNYHNYLIYEKINDQNTTRESPWIIGPEYNLGTSDSEIVTIFIGIDNVKGTYHNILTFDFESSLGIPYYQLMYLLIQDDTFSIWPLSRIFKSQ